MIKLIARRFLHRTCCLALRWRSRALPVDQPGRVLVIAPHQDDETLGCGGYIFLRRRQTLPVDVLYLTDGRASHPNHPRLAPDQIAEMRKQEAAEAMRILGLDLAALHFFAVADGTLGHLAPAEEEKISLRLAERLRQIQPREIFLPCRQDGSSEHEAAFRFVQRALSLAGVAPRVLEYPVWARWNPRRLVRPLLRSRMVWRVGFRGAEQEKRRAIDAYASQFEPTSPWLQAMMPPGFREFFVFPEEFFFER